ncbi:hypothetical protein [Caldicellulosiruptor bescii]|jgi:hypothetical protein|uniref:hypothetical protein n=1 Tax=Caldicellulosiruptor bescii TaxID=31899 RepID=UPI0001847911|nr:hypothetical protein [Caldicellulosiruptor bescii]
MEDFIYCNSIDEVKQKQQIGTSSANLKVKRKNRLIEREILVRTENISEYSKLNQIVIDYLKGF